VKTIPAADASPRYQALLQLLRTADTVWNASRVFFEGWELGPSQFNVLNLLFQNPDGLSQTELSRQLIMHRSNITGLVDRLEKRGLVRRQEVAADRRAYRVVLTQAGAGLLREILPRYYEGADRVWSKLSARRAAELVTDLQQVAQNVERIAAQERADKNPHAASGVW
jgi:DNA-binding MarR family transcriptional regulator